MKTRFWLTQIFAVCMTAMLALSSVSAASNNSPVLERISKSKVLRVGMSGEQAPFNMHNREGKLIGLDVDLAGLLAKSMGVRLEIVEMPFAKLLSALEQGKVDIVMSGVTATLERNMRVPFVGPYFITGISVLTKTETLQSVDTEEKLRAGDFNIAVLKGSTSELYARGMQGDATIAITATDTQAAGVKLLLEGKVTAVMADSPLLSLSVLRNPDAGLAVLKQPLTIEPIGIALAPGDPLLINLVQNYMNALRATGVLETAQKKWFQNSAWMAQVP